MTTNAAVPERTRFPRCRRLLAGFRRRPRAALLALVLLALLAVAGVLLAPQLRALYHARAADQAIARGDFEEARSHLAMCLEVWPDRPATLLLAARTAGRAGHFDEAEDHLRHLQSLRGPSDQIALERALLSAERGDVALAEGYLKSKVGPDHPDAPVVYEALARGYLLSDRVPDALDCTDQWLKVRPGDTQALYYRGRAFERLGKWGDAGDAHRRAVEADPDNAEAQLHLGQLMLRFTKDAAGALEHFERARARRPADPDVLLGLASCQRALGHPDAARDLLDGLLSAHPNHARALSERGRLALDEGDMAGAEAWLRRATALAPEDNEALDGLIRALKAQDKEQEARELEPRLAQLVADLRRLEQVVPAVAKEPGNLALRLEAAELFLRLGRKADGRRMLASVLQIDPRNEEARRALQKLDGASEPAPPAGGPP